MKAGMGMLLWTSFVEEKHLPVLAELKQMGYDGVEIPVVGGDDEHYHWLGEQLRALELECTAVGFLTAEEDPSAEDFAMRAKAVGRIGQLARRAEAMGASLMAGPVHEAYAHFPGPVTEPELARAVESLAAGADLAADHGVTLLCEPLNRFESRLANTVGQAAELVRRAARPNLGVAFDSHHAALEASDVAQELRAVGSALGHVQLSENHRGVPGTGQIDYLGLGKILGELEYQGWLVVEAFSRIDPELGQMLHVWRGLADDWQVVASEGLKVVGQVRQAARQAAEQA